MAEPIKSERLLFRPGEQRKYLLEAQKALNLTNQSLADLLSVSSRTVSDWKREKFLIPFLKARHLSDKSRVSITKDVIVKKPFWQIGKAAAAGGWAVYKKYGYVGGDPKLRRKKWLQWWQKSGQFKHWLISTPKSIHKPKKSELLAEFVGIMLGDGGISNHQVFITLNFKADKEYIAFVVYLVKKLFRVEPSIYHRKFYSVDNIVVSRIELVNFLEQIGLRRGHKVNHQVDIPEWIKQNIKFQAACLRGLIDTDGCIFNHKYKVNGRKYNYKKLSFTSMSEPLRRSVFRFFSELGLHPRFAQSKDVRLDRTEDVKKYFLLVGSHNFKHLKNYSK